MGITKISILICRQTNTKKPPTCFEFLFAHLQKLLPQVEDDSSKEMKERKWELLKWEDLPTLCAFEKLQVFHKHFSIYSFQIERIAINHSGKDTPLLQSSK